MENTLRSNPGPYRATKLWNEVLHAFRDNMPVGRHRRNMRTYENCFVASDSVDWLHHYLKGNSNFGSGVSRYQTVQLLQKFLKGQVFVDVRGSKHKEQFQDNGRLYRFMPKSPVKNVRTPLKRKKNIGNNQQTPVHRPVKLDFTDVVKPADPCVSRSDLPKCHLVVKELTPEEKENVFKTATIAKLRRILAVRSLDEVVEMPKVKGQHVRHNLTYLNKTGVVTNIRKDEQLPHWILSAMRCLAYWPDQGEDTFSQRYPGFERDVFRAVTEHFQSIDEPLLTYDFYELFINVFLHVENPDAKRSSPRGNSTYGFSPMSHESFVSVENLVLSMASPAAQQLKLSQWNVSEINASMENFNFLPPARPMTSSEPNILDNTFVSEAESSRSNHPTSFYDNFAFERTDSDRSQNSNLQRHYSSNDLDDAEHYLHSMKMRTRKPSNTSMCSSRSGSSAVSGRSGVSHVSGRSGVSHVSGRSAYSTATAYSAHSSMSTATTRTDPGYSYVKSARKLNTTTDCNTLDRSFSFPHHGKRREPPPRYRDPPPYGSIHRTASIQTFSSFQSECDSTPVSRNDRAVVRQQRTRSVYSALWEHSSNVFSDTHETRLISALQICCLLLPPSHRRKLHLLLRLMNKMVNNTELNLDDSLSVRTKVLQTFYRCVLDSAVVSEFDEQTSLCLVAFMMDHYERIMTVPQELKEHIETRLAEMQRAQVKYVEDPMMVTFCKRLTKEEFEKETLTNSEQAISDLLDTIVRNEKMAFKDKKKKLRQFQKEYPKIYHLKFPDANSEAAVIPSKLKSRTPLLSGAINKLKTMRL